MTNWPKHYEYSFICFRAGCGNCKCPLWKHNLPQDAAGHPFNRMNVHEALPPLISEYDKALTEGYTWVPRGLRTSQVKLNKIKKTFERIIVA